MASSAPMNAKRLPVKGKSARGQPSAGDSVNRKPFICYTCDKPARIVGKDESRIIVCSSDPKHNKPLGMKSMNPNMYCYACDKTTPGCTYPTCTYCYICNTTTLWEGKPDIKGTIKAEAGKLRPVVTPKINAKPSTSKNAGAVATTKPVSKRIVKTQTAKDSPAVINGKPVVTIPPSTSGKTTSLPLSEHQVKQMYEREAKGTKIIKIVGEAMKTGNSNFRGAERPMQVKLASEAKEALKAYRLSLPNYLNVMWKSGKKGSGGLRNIPSRMPKHPGYPTLLHSAILAALSHEISVDEETALADLAYYSALWDQNLIRINKNKKAAKAAAVLLRVGKTLAVKAGNYPAQHSLPVRAKASRRSPSAKQQPKVTENPEPQLKTQMSYAQALRLGIVTRKVKDQVSALRLVSPKRVNTRRPVRKTSSTGVPAQRQSRSRVRRTLTPKVVTTIASPMLSAPDQSSQVSVVKKMQ